MKCLKCNEEMKKGYIQSSRIIFWGEEKHKAMFMPSKESEFFVSKGLFNGSTAESFYCEKCKLLITEVKE